MPGDTGGLCVVCWVVLISCAARKGFVGASRGLRPGALAGEGSAGDKVAGETTLGLRNGLLDWFPDDNGSVRPGEGRRTVYEQNAEISLFCFLFLVSRVPYQALYGVAHVLLAIA
jgi:hypothetical protein